MAIGARVDVAGCKIALSRNVRNSVPDVTEQEFIVSYELVAGIEVAPRGDRHIFRSRAATRYSLIYARTAREIYHIVVEGKGLALGVAF